MSPWLCLNTTSKDAQSSYDCFVVSSSRSSLASSASSRTPNSNQSMRALACTMAASLDGSQSCSAHHSRRMRSSIFMVSLVSGSLGQSVFAMVTPFLDDDSGRRAMSNHQKATRAQNLSGLVVNLRTDGDGMARPSICDHPIFGEDAPGHFRFRSYPRDALQREPRAVSLQRFGPRFAYRDPFRRRRGWWHMPP
ncbi:hypothetical protein ACVJBD_004917 [Rhizobium mongolense]